MTYFDQATETLPREELAALQLSKLQAMSAELWGKNRFYTDKWRAAGVEPGDIRSLADLAKLPLTKKCELMDDQAANAPFGTNLTYPIEQYVRLHQTSGTTGVPLKVLDTADSWDWWGRCWAHVLAGSGVNSSDRVFLAFAFGPFIGFWAAMEGARKIGAVMIPGGGRDSAQRLELMRDTGATVLCCTPTYALRLAEVARETGFDLSAIPMKSTVHAGEPGANIPATKNRIEGAWSAKCFDHAGASEIGAHSFECEVQPGGTHVIESEFIVEVINPETLEAVAPGQRGELVITNLGRWGFPLVRYRTGDLVETDLSPCGCGRSFLRFTGGILGRADDMVTVRGVNVFPAGVENILRKFAEVDEFRITVNKVKQMDEMDIEVELREGSDPRIVQAIAERLDAMLAFRPRVMDVGRNILPRFDMKAKRFHVNRAS
ncbi:MAG: phenylacetate--CoA ligase family protein [Aromatoleum sp.]|jgi:phenylacetate-CoA ligase|uniref:phenylacetate--CoA ligase family protein n=1 Tax=Aromatoleum sp. TaxID=2307007 RepID=UPI002895D076|nr:AMP-binding protein [Aromatoleum sp.]MDT3672558.1 phenylacetate--CoA ligase family protein [Aromatoleum sp.]